MTIQDFSKHLEGIRWSLRLQLERDLPKKIGNLAVRMFKNNFQKEGFFGKKWKEVQRRGTKGAAGRHKILTSSGNLGRSIQATPGDGYVTVYSDLPYAEAHNEGTNNAGRRHNVRIPQRQFMGESKELTEAIEKKIKEEIDKVFNKK